jgi:hypothetical protein
MAARYTIHPNAPYEAYARLRDVEWYRENDPELPPLALATLQALRDRAATPHPQKMPAELEVAEQVYLILGMLRACQRRALRQGLDVLDLPEGAIAVLVAAIGGEPADPAQLAQARAEASELTATIRLKLAKAFVNGPPYHAATAPNN